MKCVLKLLYMYACRAGSDGSMFVSGSAGPGFDPGGVVNFHLKIFNLGTRRGDKKRKGIPITGHEGPRGMWMQGFTHSQPRH